MPCSVQNFTMGKITNLMSTDTTRIDFLCGYFHIIWAAPVVPLIGLGLLICNLGVSGLAGFAIMASTSLLHATYNLMAILISIITSGYHGTTSSESDENAFQVAPKGSI